MHYLFLPILLYLMMGLPTCFGQSTNPSSDRRSDSHLPDICGLSFVAPPQPFRDNPMPAVHAVKANWIAVIPYGFTRKGETSVRFNMNQHQWWGEREIGIRRTIELARQGDINVMLKPQVWGHNLWTGDLDFDTDDEWRDWENAYRSYILFFADIAQDMAVEMFCIGTEFKIAAVKREDFWRKLIVEVRSRYDGPLTYASNWDHYAKIPFWNALDLVGINAYFPLASEKTPSIRALNQSWKKWLDEMDQFHHQVKKPIAFTEYGYLSVDGCAFNTWELEGRVKQTPINEVAQANALEALFTNLSKRDYWRGGFLWKWFPNMKGHEGYPERDYTPQGKQGEAVLKQWYGKWLQP